MAFRDVAHHDAQPVIQVKDLLQNAAVEEPVAVGEDEVAAEAAGGKGKRFQRTKKGLKKIQHIPPKKTGEKN